MLPFGYDTTRRLSIASLMFLIVAICLTSAILTPAYLNNYHTGEHAIIIAVSSMALNGIIHWIRCVVENNVQLPHWPGKKQRDADQDEQW